MTEEETAEKPLAGLTDEEKSEVVTSAIKEIDVQDIIVCGKCHEVYHMIDEFKEHKDGESCKGNGEIKDTLKDDKKPQIWAFTLWKNTKFKNLNNEDKGPTSWNIYQTWRAMKANEKQAWMTVAADMQGLFEIVANFEKSKIKAIKDKPEVKKVATPVAPSVQPVILNTKMLQMRNTRRAVRTGSDPKVEHLVEKIISKRYNPRKKTFEYLLKWEHFDSEKNTWESTAALQNCKTMIEDFEKNLQIQKEQMKIQKTLEKKTRTLQELKKLSESRPPRSSKQRALNQVKAWCGAEVDEQSKRPFSDDSEDDASYEKRIKLEASSDDSDEESSVVTIKRITKNGTDNRKPMQSLQQKIDLNNLPDNVLIPDAKGIVRINQKQIPALSSGVYVMSKTAGIIKLDTAAASKLTSGGGQTVLKVAPRTGQTSIKFVKKDINGTQAQTKSVPKAVVGSPTKTAMKNYSSKVFMQKKTNTQAAVAALAKQNEIEFQKDMSKFEDDSDGIEEMDFPTEITMPGSDSPPPEFSLCPLTGKVIDKDGNFLETEECEAELVVPEQQQAQTTTMTSTSNLVSIAAAEILHDLTDNDVKVAEEVTRSSTSPPPLTPTKTVSSTTPSILSTALTNANIVRRGPPKLVARAQPRPGILQQQQQQQQRMRAQQQQQTHAVITKIQPGRAPAPRVMSPQVAQMRPGMTTQIIRKRIIQQPGQPPQQVRQVVRRVYHQVHKGGSPQVNRVNTYVATPTSTNKVVTMPPREKPQVQVVEKVVKAAVAPPPPPPPPPVVEPEVASTSTQEITLADADQPLLITGEDGTIYQVAGQNEDGQTILITQGEDGEQQCLLVAPENASLITQALMKPNAQAQAQAEETAKEEEEAQAAAALEAQEALTINTAVEQAVEEQGDDSQVVAQIVSANPPSPGGTRKVVLMLPDGNFMMTEVTAEQYAALELDK